MLGVDKALEITQKSIQNIGGLKKTDPIFLEHTLNELRIRTESLIRLFRVDVVDGVDAIDFELDANFLRNISPDTTFGQVVDIVALNSERK